MSLARNRTALYEFDPPRARELRSRLVGQLERGGEIRDDRVREALLRVPRHLFVAPGTPLDEAYADRSLPIGHGQAIAQPSVVARTTEALELSGTERILEIGTGSGYHAAVLSELAAEVHSIEALEPLARRAARVLADLGCSNVVVRAGEGSDGWPRRAPFDRVVSGAATEEGPGRRGSISISWRTGASSWRRSAAPGAVSACCVRSGTTVKRGSTTSGPLPSFRCSRAERGVRPSERALELEPRPTRANHGQKQRARLLWTVRRCHDDEHDPRSDEGSAGDEADGGQRRIQ